MNAFISKFVIFPPKKQVVKIRQIEADSDSYSDENHTCSRLQKKLVALVRFMLNILSCSSEIFFFIDVFWSLEVKYIFKCNMYFCKNMSLLIGGSLTHKTSAGDWKAIVRCPTGIGRFVKIFKFLALVRHRTMPGRAPYGARTGKV